MANIKKIDAERFPVLYGEKTRPASVVENKKELQVEGQAFTNYAPNAGSIYRFTSFEDAVIKKQQVQEGGKSYQFLILCVESVDGGKTFHDSVLSLNSLGKIDADNVPCHPTWYALGNIGNRAKKLCEMGEITVGKEPRTIKVVVFDNGNRKMVVSRNDKGEPILDENNNPVMVPELKDQTIYDLTPVA